MKAKFTEEFFKQYKKANVRIRNQFDKRLRIFTQNPQDPQLNNHKLKRDWQGHRSIDITSDWRAIYKEIQMGDGKVAYFVAIGTHKELYK